jgi:diaminopimelate epimerase
MNVMKFAKMSATGNDFILFDNRKNILQGNEKDYFRNICRRRFSVGADGVILLEQSLSSDFQYRHFNSDGQAVILCGNGARAICQYAFLKKLAKRNMEFEADGIVYHGYCSGDDVTVDHPKPFNIQTKTGIVSEDNFEEGGFLMIGVPHLVIFCDNIQEIDILRSGKKYRHHAFFKQGSNVNFVQTIDNKTIKVRTFERGVEGETFSCGTGAMASALISHVSKGIRNPVKVITKGGKLEVDWEQDFSPLSLSGKAKLVFEGQFIEKSVP